MNIPGRFNVANALAAVSVLSFLGLPKENICHGLEHLNVNGRMEIVYSSEKCTVIVDYAHNAVSMESLLSTLRDYHPKRLSASLAAAETVPRTGVFPWETAPDVWQILRLSPRIIPDTKKNGRYHRGHSWKP